MRYFIGLLISVWAVTLPAQSLVTPTVKDGSSTTVTVTVTILPGPFLVEAHQEDGWFIVDVTDATGSGAGWEVWIDSPNGELIPLSGIQDLSGKYPVDTETGPQLSGNRFFAEQGESGMGKFRIYFQDFPGTWFITSSQGAL